MGIVIKIDRYVLCLRMDVLVIFYAVFNCREKQECFGPPKRKPFELRGNSRGRAVSVSLARKAKIPIVDGCVGYLVDIVIINA